MSARGRAARRRVVASVRPVAIAAGNLSTGSFLVLTVAIGPGALATLVVAALVFGFTG
ncbi:hypothetical protein [Nocardia sp. MW-W600-9]